MLASNNSCVDQAKRRGDDDDDDDDDDDGNHLFQNFRENICLRTCRASELFSLTLVSNCETIDCRSSCLGTCKPAADVPSTALPSI
ncbi:unnamed protein product [Haemonchus placei]|uniref:ShKT domain-containing protein n=1 Tax=Haemonchus placei TaxID=6290 RepID=A0A0N4VWH3_HAEPC|nr:unnamed protein product [Haemonchus placei]